MGEPYDYPVRDLWPMRNCPKCHGRGATTTKAFKEGDYCDCIHEQLIHKSDFIRLSDGLIEVHTYEGDASNGEA